MRSIAMAAASGLLQDVIGQDGRVSPDKLSLCLRVTRLQLATATGLSRDAVSKTACLNASATQARLRDVIEIINRVRGWAGSEAAAFTWYRSQSLPGFGDQTAEDLVKAGRAEAVKRYLAEIAIGGYA
jgi:hypothetical protein